jgi:glyceraldehyde 3-phosphate dehydrogenase
MQTGTQQQLSQSQQERRSMTTKVAISGFGRIGRLVFRHLMDEEGLEVVAVNDIARLDNLAYLLRYDSTQQNPPQTIAVDGASLLWDGREVPFTSIRKPAELPWKELGVDVAIEATGRFTERTHALKHRNAGARRVIVTAAGSDPDLTVVLGVNEDKFDPAKHVVISNASCTTNAAAPVAKVLDDEFAILVGFLTTVHAYTNSQRLVDKPNKEWRRSRAAGISIVPTTTGAAVATTRVLPHLKGKLDGMALRVPVAAGSIIDFVVQTGKPVTVDKVNTAFRQAAESEAMRGILGVTDEPLVSADIVGSPFSAIVDLQSTMVLGDYAAKVLAWYDNEWAYAKRVADLVRYITA